MISTCHPNAPSPPAREPVTTVGGWLFVPDRRNPAGDVHTGYLACNGRRVVLRHTSRLLADFLRQIRQLEGEFTARIEPQPNDRAGGARCTTG
ncbi:hypothetical protein ACFW1A_25510 [Kitasatospora sp. NPDC058965]|uniref:hypothetical protein n=1 Tax=Kitasatospora sp. NPDC058965 TaxID=3346682 RepID=UPI00368A8D62